MIEKKPSAFEVHSALWSIKQIYFRSIELMYIIFSASIAWINECFLFFFCDIKIIG